MGDRRRYLHPDDDMVYACPECDYVPINRRKQDNTVVAKGYEFVCYQCGTGFDEPRERKSRQNTPQTPNTETRAAKGTIARKLEDMEPDELGA